MRTVKRIMVCCLMVSLAVFIVSCVAPEQKKDTAGGIPIITMPPAEQEQKSTEAMEELVEFTAGKFRSQIVDDIEKKLVEVKDKYPNSSWAEQAYWRLITMNIADYHPARFDKVEEYYKEYFQRYKKPALDYLINDTVARGYYNNSQWEKLVIFLEPYVKLILTTEKRLYPHFMYFYTEAKFHLKEFDEAEKGYNLILYYFPDSQEAKLAKDRLNTLKHHTGKKGEK